MHETGRNMNSLLAVVSLIIITVVPAVAGSAASAQAEVPEQIAPYLQPQRLVRIAGGRTINLVCLGARLADRRLNGWLGRLVAGMVPDSGSAFTQNARLRVGSRRSGLQQRELRAAGRCSQNRRP